MSQTKTTPEVLWAQRSSTTDAEKNYIHVTISAPDVPKIDVDLKPTSLTFTGHSDTKKTTYHVELEFFGEIDVENSKTTHTTRDVEFVLRKKELKEEYWPRLLKESKKVHFLKTDFDKWVDEDEQNAAPDDADLGGMGGMGGMPGMGGMGGMGGMPGMGGDGGFGGIDFSKLGGMGGGAEGMEGIDDGAGGEDDDDDDDEMPGLEDEESTEKPETTADGAKQESSAASSKVEEIPSAPASKKIEEVS